MPGDTDHIPIHRTPLSLAQREEPSDALSLEEQCTLNQLLRAMDEDDQALLVPYYAYGFSAEAIGQATHTPTRTVLFRIGKAIQRTRRRLGLPADLPQLSARELEL